MRKSSWDKTKQIFFQYRWGLQLAASASPFRTKCWFLLLIFSSLLSPAILEITRQCLKAIENGARQAQSLIQADVIGSSLILAALLLIQIVISSGLKYARSRLAEAIQSHVLDRIHAQACELPMRFFDHSAGYDQLHRARFESATQPMALLEQSGTLLQNAVIVVAVSIMLIRYEWWVPVVLVTAALPSLWVLAKQALDGSKINYQLTLDRRRSLNLSTLMTERVSAAELRLFNLAAYFRAQRQKVQSRIESLQSDLDWRGFKGGIFAGISGWVGTLMVLFWMINRHQSASAAGVADLVMLYQAFLLCQRALMSSLESAGGLYRASVYLGDLHEFLHRQTESEVDSELSVAMPKVTDAIKLHNVSFQYPGASRPSLNNVSMQFRAGKITAIVGFNGAGKSTLLRLLCRFYPPDRGHISIDGTDLKHIHPQALRANIGVLFQESLRFNATAWENIACGDVDALMHEPLEIDAMLRVQAATQAASAQVLIDRFPNRYEQLLGKPVGGAELSGGEWQRIGLARALVRDSQILLLDEPTSAMDSWTEASWFDRLREFTKGKTVVLITHRFATACQADEIYVMESGAVREAGRHVELIRKNGLYAQAWAAQRKKN